MGNNNGYLVWEGHFRTEEQREHRIDLEEGSVKTVRYAVFEEYFLDAPDDSRRSWVVEAPVLCKRAGGK